MVNRATVLLNGEHFIIVKGPEGQVKVLTVAYNS
jgi:hypothetical protein